MVIFIYSLIQLDLFLDAHDKGMDALDFLKQSNSKYYPGDEKNDANNKWESYTKMANRDSFKNKNM